MIREQLKWELKDGGMSLDLNTLFAEAASEGRRSSSSGKYLMCFGNGYKFFNFSVASREQLKRTFLIRALNMQA